MPKINREEYNVLKSLGERWIWIARDSGDDYIGQLFVYLEKPIKSYDVGCWQDYDGGGFSSTDNYLFQFIQWSDSEPYNIAELIRGYEWAQLNEEYPPVGEREEKEVKRDKEDLVKYLEKEISNFKPGEMIYDYLTFILKQLNELDEPETLSEDWINDNVEYAYYMTPRGTYSSAKAVIDLNKLKNLLVPKQEGVDRPYKDGYTLEEEQKYYALIKGHELLEGKGDWVVPMYWYLDTTNGNMFISDRITVLDKFLVEASKSEWNKLGINNSNADFVKVEELE